MQAVPTFSREIIERARPGHKWTYWIGFLPLDRRNRAVAERARIALAAYYEGLIELTQLKIDEGLYAYLATKRKRVRKPQ